MVQWLRLWGPKAGGLALTPGQGTRRYTTQLKDPRGSNWDLAQPKTFFKNKRLKKNHVVEAYLDFLGGSMVKDPPANAGNEGATPRWGLTCVEMNGNQYSCLENLTDRGAWRAAVYGVTKSQTGSSDWAHIHAEAYLQIWRYFPGKNHNQTITNVCIHRYISEKLYTNVSSYQG